MYTHIVPTSRNLRHMLFSFGSFGYADVSSPSFMLPSPWQVWRLWTLANWPPAEGEPDLSSLWPRFDVLIWKVRGGCLATESQKLIPAF